MDAKQYYSQRQGNIKPLDLEDLKVAFESIYDSFHEKYYFIDFLGKSIHSNDGIVGKSFETYCMRKLNRNIDPPHLARYYMEEDLFDVIELLYDYINYPILNPRDNNWSNEVVSSIPEKKEIAQKQFRDEINVYLRQYTSGWELADEGYIRSTFEEGLIELVDSKAFYGDEVNVDAKIRRAKELYLRRGSSSEDKKAAVREIGDALEFVRTELKQIVGKDESDIFNVLNNFEIRHNNAFQKKDYDHKIYLPWMFYTFLSTYDAFVKITNDRTNNSNPGSH